MIALLLLALTPRSTPEAVYFSSRAMVAEEVLGDLSRNVGVKLEAGAALRNDVLIVASDGRPLTEVMEKLALVTEARWQQAGQEWILNRSAEVEARQKEESAKIVGADLRKSFADAGESGSLGRLVSDCMEDGLWGEVGLLPIGDLAVYATSPTDLQKPLGARARAVLREFQKGPAGDAKLTLTFHRETGWNIKATARLIGRSGNVLREEDFTELLERARDPDAKHKLVPMMQPVSDSDRFEFAWRGYGGFGGDTRSYAKSVREEALDPVRVDPLGLFESEGVLEFARRTKKSVVAMLRDDLDFGQYQEEDYIDLGQAMLELMTGEKATESEKWLTIQPRDPYEARQWRADRRGLKAFAIAHQQSGPLGIEPMLELRQLTPDSYAHSTARLFGAVLKGAFGSSGSWSFEKLLGSFSPAQLAHLLAGRSLGVGDLTPEQVHRVFVALQDSGPYQVMPFVQHDDPSRDPSQFLAGKFPGGVKVTAVESSETSYGFFDPLNPDRLLFWSTAVGTWNGAPPFAPKSGFDALLYKRHVERIVKLRIEAAPGFWKEVKFSEEPVAQDPGVVWGRLSREVQDEIKPSLDFYKQIAFPPVK